MRALLLFFLVVLAHAVTRYVVEIPHARVANIADAFKQSELKISDAIGPPGWYVVEAPSPSHNHVHSMRSLATQMEELVALERFTRTTDPRLVDAWHLTGVDSSGGAIPVTLNATQAWSIARGRGVTIAIVDDGLARTHRDMRDNFKIATSLSLCDGRTSVDPPDSQSTHGSMAAAVAAASFDNGVCSAGVAPEAGLSGIRLLTCRMDDASEATALSYMCDGEAGARNDIYSSSWGPRDDGMRTEKPGIATSAAMKFCIENGRDGKGSIYVFAAGNGGRADNTNFDGYASSRYVIAVGAIMDAGVAPTYGEPGASMLVSVGSNGGPRGERSKIVTASFNPRDDAKCDGFGGTSAAAPQVAGVAALMLELRPDLTWRDVKDILVRAAVPIDPYNVAQPWVMNNAGLFFSNQYGFGQVTLPRVLDLTRAHVLMAPERQYCSSVRDANHAVVRGDNMLRSFIFDVNTGVTRIETVALRIALQFGGRMRDLSTLILESPAGTQSTLVGSNSQTQRSLDWSLSSNAFWGERADGRWKVLIRNTGRNDMTLERVQLCVYGQAVAQLE